MALYECVTYRYVLLLEKTGFCERQGMEDGSGDGQVNRDNPSRHVCMLIGLSIPKGAHSIHAGGCSLELFSSPCQYCIVVEANNAEDLNLGEIQA